MTTKQNKIEDLLVSLGLSSPGSAEPFFPRTRDAADLPVVRCRISGVIYLSRTDHVEPSHYEQKEGFKFVAPDMTRQQALVASQEDSARRAQAIRPMVANKRWLDFGTGSGGVLEALQGVPLEVSGCEPQVQAREALRHLSSTMYADLSEVPRQHFDAITLFHVLEHIDEPITVLRALRECLKPRGRIYIEVPHARDFLLSLLSLDAFKQFTLWSEHLMLHTRDSLRRCVEAAGFSRVVVEGVQRYPLANHLQWLSSGRPGGHNELSFLRSVPLDDAYGAQLARLDMTDTLVAHAVV